MPALKLFGRKWLAGSDDLVYPGVLEICYRLVWLTLIILILAKYYAHTWQCESGGVYIRAYLIGMVILLVISIFILISLVNRSAKGAIMEVEKRKLVAPILMFKLFLIMPEIALNIIGTVWTFCDIIQCNHDGHYTKTVIKTLVIFDWVLFGLTIFGLILIFDPVGSKRYNENYDVALEESLKHKKVMSVWKRRFKWAFYWVRSDEYGHEAFKQVAGLLTALFRSTDLVPTDILSGCILLRVQQKRESREMRRIQMISDSEPKYSTDLNRIFAMCPKWMNLENARHFLCLSMAAYGWPFVMYRYCGTGLCRMFKYFRCCACIRPVKYPVTDDNCCLCHFAGFRYISKILNEDDILFASFKNHVYELPFVVLRDNKTKSIVVAIRGSISLRDIFTDLTAVSEPFEAENLPPGTMAHKGMAFGAEFVLKRLNDTKIIERAFETYPDYGFILTGHSLGAGVACLLALKLKPKYPDVKVYAFSTPAGLISREAARLTENFIFTLGVGDDFVMRLGVDSVENLRTGIMQTLYATRLPKYRILLNGCGYMFFGVPTRDLESSWKKEFCIDLSSELPLISTKNFQTNILPKSSIKETCSYTKRNCVHKRYSKSKLFTAGRILHIVYCKRTKQERKAKTGKPSFEMRWAIAEDFREVKVMPRMLLDHLPENVYKAIDTILNEKRDNIISTI